MKVIIYYFFLVSTFSFISLSEAAIRTDKISFISGINVNVSYNYEAIYDSMSKQVVLNVIIHNPLPAREMVVRLSGDLEFQQTINMPAYESRRWFWYLPVVRSSSYLRYQLEITDQLTGERQLLKLRESLRLDSRKRYFGRLGINPPPLPKYNKKHWHNVGLIEAQEIPDLWHGLARYDVLFVNYDLLTTATWRTVMNDWVSMGGTLAIFAPNQTATTVWQLFDDLPFRQLSTGDVLRAGAGAIIYLNNEDYDLSAPKFSIKSTLKRYHGLSNREVKQFLDQHLGDIGRPNQGLLFSILLTFTLLVGPIAWVILIRKKAKPFHYIALVLAVSFVTSGSIFIISMLSEGITMKSWHSSLQLLDLTQAKQLYIEEDTVFRSTSLAGKQLYLPNHAILSQTRNQKNDLLPTELLVQPQGGGVTIANAIPVRQRAILTRRGVQQINGRLLINTNNKQLTVENHLGIDLHSVFLTTGKSCYQLDTLLAGGRQRAISTGCRSQPITLPFMVKTPFFNIANQIIRKNYGQRFFYATTTALSKDDVFLMGKERQVKTADHQLLGVW